MFCPQCGTESSAGQQYCRSCGANLKFIGKAVTLSEAIARSDRGPLPKIKEMMQSVKAEHSTEDVTHALDQMNTEIVRSFPEAGKLQKPKKDERSPAERRENHIVKGMVSLFSGVALMIFLYYLSLSLVLKIPPDVLEKIPFEVEPVARMLWLIGLIPAMSGLGRIIAGYLVRPERQAAALEETKPIETPEPRLAPVAEEIASPPASVTERTTDLLEHKTVTPSD